MKKNLTLLTGIVVSFTILVASGCGNTSKQNDPAPLEDDSTLVVYLKAIDQDDGRKHLEMYNGKDSLNTVIDSLYTDVQPGYTVIWKKAHNSGIKKVNDIRPMKKDGKIFIEDAREVKSLFKLEIPINAPPGVEKYEIVFTDKDDNTWCIDPFLRIR